MRIKIEVPDDCIASAICSAVESGIYYWVDRKFGVEFLGEGKPPEGSCLSNYPRYFAPLQEGSMILYEDQTKKRFELKSRDFGGALERMSAQVPHQFAQLLEENGDAITGDVLVQLACFETVKYG